MNTNGKHPMSVQIETITPARAKELLTRNTHNRGVSRSRVERLAGAIRRGEWTLGVDAIALAVDGTLLNGQHRLHAIVDSKKAIQVMVAYNVPTAFQETMDIGAKRTVADMLKMRGYTNVQILAASARIYWQYATNANLQHIPPLPTPQQVMTIAQEHKNLTLACTMAKRISDVLPVSPALTCALWTLFIEHDDYEVVSTFWDRIETGEGLRSGDAIYALRQHLHRLGRQNAIKRPPSWVVGALIIKSFNAWREGRTVEVASFKPGIEAFPLIEDARVLAGVS